MEMKFTKEQLEEAVNMVRMKQITYGNASMIYGILRSTLPDHENGIYNQTSKGSVLALSSEIEEWLYTWLIKWHELIMGSPKKISLIEYRKS